MNKKNTEIMNAQTFPWILDLAPGALEVDWSRPALEGALAKQVQVQSTIYAMRGSVVEVEAERVRGMRIFTKLVVKVKGHTGCDYVYVLVKGKRPGTFLVVNCWIVISKITI